MLLVRVRLLLTVFWVGSLWTVGYLVAPTLFVTLFDRVLAGTIAGSLFRTEAWFSLFCGGMLLVLQKVRNKRTTDNAQASLTAARLILAMLVCTAVGYFCLQPFMASLREAAGSAGVMASDVKLKFGVLHGIASGLYLIESLLGVALILKTRGD